MGDAGPIGGEQVPVGYSQIGMASACAVSATECIAAAASQSFNCAAPGVGVAAACSGEPELASAGNGGVAPPRVNANSCRPEPDDNAVKQGDVGRYGALKSRSVTGDGLDLNHIPQKALLPQRGVAAADGGAVAMLASDHRATRTWGSRGKVTMKDDWGRDLQEVLNDDVNDLRGLGLCFDVEAASISFRSIGTGRGSSRMNDIRPEVATLAAWAPLPTENDWTEYDLERYAADVDAVVAPISTAERLALMPLLDMPTEDDAFGITNGVMHLIESAPHPPFWWRDLDDSKPWFHTIRVRGLNYERAHPELLTGTGELAVPPPAT
jgi:hypothetical protein